MIYCFDIDGTICTKVLHSKYDTAIPYLNIIDHINNLYDNNNEIIIMSARGSVSGVDYEIFTKNQLKKWGLKYHKLIMNVKPNADFFIDDKAININEYKDKFIEKKTGLITGGFDVIHPGYIEMFIDAKKKCNYLIVALHEDPSLENNKKLKPILTVEERKQILSSIKYVDKILSYKTEIELYDLLKNNHVDVRFLGDDYKNKKFTGDDLNIKIHFINREHNWSATKFKNMIKDSI